MCLSVLQIGTCKHNILRLRNNSLLTAFYFISLLVQMKILRVLLAPFGVIYWSVIVFRNYLFDIGHKRGVKFDIPTICVGNLAVGGTGKTPHVEYLIRLFKDTKKITTLSRGYKRKSRGLVFADENSTSDDVGDEAFQVYTKFSGDINTVVCTDRVSGILMIAGELPDTNLIILDDAYQHRSVRYDFNILISDIQNPFYNDYTLPFGDLRDYRKSAKRANAVVFSKCSLDLSLNDQELAIAETKRYTDAPVFFSAMKYGAVTKVQSQEVLQEGVEIALITGIAKPSALKAYLESQYQVLKHFEYLDHHDFHEGNIKSIRKFLEQNPAVKIVTTEKDYARLRNHKETELWDLYLAPIEVRFLNNEVAFQKLVKSTVEV